MKALLFHCQNFGQKITGLATRPANIVPDKIIFTSNSIKDCVLALTTIENGDTLEKANNMAREIVKFCENTKHFNVFFCPFAHLSNNLAGHSEAKKILVEIIAQLKKSDVNLIEGHFGSDKELLIHLYGHPGNARYREF